MVNFDQLLSSIFRCAQQCWVSISIKGYVCPSFCWSIILSAIVFIVKASKEIWQNIIFSIQKELSQKKKVCQLICRQIFVIKRSAAEKLSASTEVGGKLWITLKTLSITHTFENGYFYFYFNENFCRWREMALGWLLFIFKQKNGVTLPVCFELLAHP